MMNFSKLSYRKCLALIKNQMKPSTTVQVTVQTLIALGISSVSFGQTLTLDQALSEGLAQSPQIQQAKAARSGSEWKVREAVGSGFLPKLKVGAHHYFDAKYSSMGMSFGGASLNFPALYPQDAASLDFSLPLFDGLANIRSLQAARLMDEASGQELSYAEFELREDIRLAYYHALAAQKLQVVSTENVKTLEDHLKQTTIQKRGGAATNYDVLRVQVQLSEANSDAIDANDNVTVTRKKLAQLLGLESDDRALTGDLPAPDAARVSNLDLNSSSTARADIRASELKADAAHRSRQAAAAWLSPTVSIQGDYTLYNQQNYGTSVENTGNFQNSYSLGIFLNWNLFDGGVALAREREASFTRIQAEKAAQIKKVQVPYDFEYWKRRYLSNTNRYVAKQLDIQRSQESVRLSKQEEKAGTRTSTETLDAELELFRSRAGLVNALMNALEAQLQLEKTLGREI